MPNKLPQGWVECQLKDIATVKGGKRLPAGAKYSESITNYPYIRVTNFENMTVNTNDLKYLTPEIQNKIKNYTISKEDIYISIAGSIGKVGIIPDELDGANLTENAAKIIHCINKKFLTHILNSIEIQNQISTYTKSTTQPKLALYRIEELKILLPPMNEQRRIVEKIESEFAKIDEGLEHLENAKEQIKQYRQSVLKSAFEGKLYKTTEWIESELINLCKSISAGGDRPEIYSETPTQDCKIPIYSNGIKDNGLYGYTNLARIKEPAITVSARGTIGFVCARYKPYFPIVRLISVIPELSLLDIEFLKYFLSFVVPKGEGSSIPQLTVPNFKKYSIILPTLEEQKKIVEEIDKRFAIADEVEKAVEQNIEKAKQLKQSILKKAFEGRLVPQDPTDEPATILLEKIKQERSKNAK